MLTPSAYTLLASTPPRSLSCHLLCHLLSRADLSHWRSLDPVELATALHTNLMDISRAITILYDCGLLEKGKSVKVPNKGGGVRHVDLYRIRREYLSIAK